MSQNKVKIEQIIKDLEIDVQESESLFKLICDQYKAIALGDSEGLNLVNSKIELITEVLREHADTRAENLRYLKIEPNEIGLETLAGKLPSKIKNKVIELKKNLESNIFICKEANDKSANQLILAKEMIAKITGSQKQDYLE